VLTHTKPCPPPSAGLAASVSDRAGAAESGLLAELLGLNKSPSENFGEAVAVAAAVAAASVGFLRLRFGLGDAAGDSELAAEAEVFTAALGCSVLFHGRDRLAAAGDSAGDAACAIVDCVSALLCARCFFAEVGDSAGEGD
jgi:hypothetical protein